MTTQVQAQGQPRRERQIRGPWLFVGIALIVAALLGGVLYTTTRSSAQTTAPATTTVTRGALTATVDGSGAVEGAQSLDMNFQTSGMVTEVLVKEGDSVTSGQPLATIDTRDLQSKVESAQANVNSAKAQLAQSSAGNATPEDVAAQQASVRNAQANLEKTRTGTTTTADIADAQAGLRSAEAKLDALRNPSPDKLSAQQFQVTSAENALQSTRDSASATKTNAGIALEQSTDALTKAQTAFATAKKNWDFANERNEDPTNPTTTDSQGNTVANTLNDAQRQQYYDTFVQAEASLRSAELDVQRNQVAYDTARQDEVLQVQKAEATLANERQQLDALTTPSVNDVVQAQASVDQAAASLARLRQGGSKADVAAARATVDQTQANLDKLTAPATQSDLDIKQAAVAQAEQSLKQAQINLDLATLKAPFDGVITTVNIVPGSVVGTSGAAFTLLNRNPLHVTMSLSENDVAKVQVGQSVALTIDALSAWKATGTVGYIAPAATKTNGVVTYAVRVDFPDTDERVKVGMTSNVSIETASKQNVLLVPNTALVPSSAQQAVQVPGSGTNVAAQEVTVETGVSDGTNTEITGGLTEGQTIITTPASQAPKTSGGLFGG